MTERRHWAQANAEPVAGASGVLPISLDALGHLGVDEDGNLFWRDTQVMTVKKQIKLSVAQWIVAILTVIAALIAACAAAVSAYTDLKTYRASEEREVGA